jgi:hypothetical protein
MMHEDDVKSVSSLADFVADLERDIRESKDQIILQMFLRAMSRWLHDVEGSGMLPDSVQKNPEVCRAFAEILLAARHYD